MAKNVRFNTRSLIALACVVPIGVLSGAVRVLGGGLTVHAMTDRATADTIAKGTSAPGLKEGQASCNLVGVHLVVDLPIVNAVAQYAKVYVVDADGTYTATAGGNKFIGYALDALAAPGTTRVALTNV